MKIRKRVLSVIALLVISVSMLFAVTACAGGNSNESPESSIKDRLEAMTSFNADKIVNTIYFANKDLENEFKTKFNAGSAVINALYEEYKTEVIDFKYNKTETVAEADWVKVDGITFEEVEKGTASASIKITGKTKPMGDMPSQTVNQTTSMPEDEIVTYKINGKWYAGYVASSEDIDGVLGGSVGIE